jgi:AcrR family transcriptional regulator
MVPPATATRERANRRGRSTARPPRADAVRTRSALLRGAREVFERDGYVKARIADIAGAAGVAHGSFYSHFDGKAEIFEAVHAEIAEEMLHPAPVARGRGGDQPGLEAAIEAANRHYLLTYRRNAKLMALLEQVATIDDRFRRLRLERTDAFVERNARLIARLQEEGEADTVLDPRLASMALSAMVSRSAYFAFVAGRRVNVDALARTLSRLWVNSLRDCGER